MNHLLESFFIIIHFGVYEFMDKHNSVWILGIKWTLHTYFLMGSV